MIFDVCPRNEMPAFLELFVFFLMAFATDLGFNSRFLRPCLIMALVAGDAINPFLGMLAIHPGLENPPRIFLMASEAVTDLFLCPDHSRHEQKKERY